MNNSIKFSAILTCLLTTYSNLSSFAPLEFLQHLQQQAFQQKMLQAQQLRQQQAQQASQVKQPVQQPTPQPTSPAPVENTQPKETFKPFNGKCPFMLKGSFAQANPQKNEDMPSFRVYFKGKETKSDAECFFSINVEDEKIDHYTLVLTKYPKPTPQKYNTLSGLRILPNMNYTCFSSQKVGNQWILRQIKLDPNSLEIPKDAVVIHLDPKYIDHIDTWNLTLNNNFIQLPRIVLKTDLLDKPLERASAKSLLSSLDAAPFHEEVTQDVKKISDKVEIALAQ